MTNRSRNTVHAADQPTTVEGGLGSREIEISSRPDRKMSLPCILKITKLFGLAKKMAHNIHFIELQEFHSVASR